jgi:putative endonuclease
MLTIETDMTCEGVRYFVYIACCANGTFYVGYTTNVPQRLAQHNAGQGGRYTRTNRPLTLVASWTFNSRREAMLAERQTKRLSPERKWALAESTILSQEKGNEYAQKGEKQRHSL